MPKGSCTASMYLRDSTLRDGYIDRPRQVEPVQELHRLDNVQVGEVWHLWIRSPGSDPSVLEQCEDKGGTRSCQDLADTQRNSCNQ
jgi:hypothetical protein